jgi:hypothetical protein
MFKEAIKKGLEIAVIFAFGLAFWGVVLYKLSE